MSLLCCRRLKALAERNLDWTISVPAIPRCLSKGFPSTRSRSTVPFVISGRSPHRGALRADIDRGQASKFHRAECVETQEHSPSVVSMGCDRGAGRFPTASLGVGPYATLVGRSAARTGNCAPTARA